MLYVLLFSTFLNAQTLNKDEQLKQEFFANVFNHCKNLIAGNFNRRNELVTTLEKATKKKVNIPFVITEKLDKEYLQIDDDFKKSEFLMNKADVLMKSCIQEFASVSQECSKIKELEKAKKCTEQISNKINQSMSEKSPFVKFIMDEGKS